MKGKVIVKRPNYGALEKLLRSIPFLRLLFRNPVLENMEFHNTELLIEADYVTVRNCIFT